MRKPCFVLRLPAKTKVWLIVLHVDSVARCNPEKPRKLNQKSTQNRREFDAKSIEVGSSGYVEAPKSIEVGRSGPVEAPKSIEVGRSRVSRSTKYARAPQNRKDLKRRWVITLDSVDSLNPP